MNTIVHMEIPAQDIERARKFYSELFNWEWKYVEEMDYHMFATKDDEGKVPAGGGLIKKETENQAITNYINVKDIDEAAERIEDLGGKILVPKTPVPGMGWMVHFLDTENNLIAIWQTDSNAK